MKTKTIKTDKAEVLVCELPEGIDDIDNDVFVNNFGNHIRYWDKGKDYLIDLPDGNWQLLGRLPDITEYKADQVVVKSNHTGLYAHYVKYIPVNTYCYKESADSLYSLLRSNDIYFDNPFGKEPDSRNEFYRDALGITSNYWSDLLEWQEAQSKVWDKERTYLFIKTD